MDLTQHRFSGWTVVVTGAGSGIGHATARRLLMEGARVVAVDLLPERLAALADEVGDALASGDLVTVAGDVSVEATVAQAVEAAGDRIDGLANIAGIMDGFLPAAELDDATWERVLAVNLTAMMRFTRAALGPMLRAGKGAIVNVSSEAGMRASAAGTAYTTSKHAVNGFTRSTAFFYTPKGIRCNAVAPGAVATNIEAPFRSEWAQQRLGPFMQATIPGVAQPDQLAAAITWLLSDDASDVSGAILPVDGGWAAV
ncbi:SDR family NAD(P)-dependent oxidoreductase [Pseudolysinimonas sp.]|uniref:SDR family NAD(P)-dependent oxidoreductase n=1 Tax=Pseudolysinimonas sp. TaxID=2680009 RepID=UPI003F7F33E7